MQIKGFTTHFFQGIENQFNRAIDYIGHTIAPIEKKEMLSKVDLIAKKPLKDLNQTDLEAMKGEIIQLRHKILTPQTFLNPFKNIQYTFYAVLGKHASHTALGKLDDKELLINEALRLQNLDKEKTQLAEALSKEDVLKKQHVDFTEGLNKVKQKNVELTNSLGEKDKLQDKKTQVLGEIETLKKEKGLLTEDYFKLMDEINSLTDDLNRTREEAIINPQKMSEAQDALENTAKELSAFKSIFDSEKDKPSLLSLAIDSGKKSIDDYKAREGVIKDKLVSLEDTYKKVMQKIKDAEGLIQKNNDKIVALYQDIKNLDADLDKYIITTEDVEDLIQGNQEKIDELEKSLQENKKQKDALEKAIQEHQGKIKEIETLKK